MQPQFSRNLHNNIEISEESKYLNLYSDQDNKSTISSAKQESGYALSDKKRTGLLRRDKEKQSMLEKQDSVGKRNRPAANSQQERIRRTTSSGNEVVTYTARSRQREDLERQLDRNRYQDAWSLRYTLNGLFL